MTNPIQHPPLNQRAADRAHARIWRRRFPGWGRWWFSTHVRITRPIVGSLRRGCGREAR